MVGTSGSSAERVALATASGRNLPALICDIADDVVSNIICTSPERMSTCAWLLPLYGTCVVLMPAARSNASPAMCCVLPTPDDAYLISPGFAFAAATRSWTLLYGVVDPTTSTFGTTTTRPTG